MVVVVVPRAREGEAPAREEWLDCWVEDDVVTTGLVTALDADIVFVGVLVFPFSCVDDRCEAACFPSVEALEVGDELRAASFVRDRDGVEDKDTDDDEAAAFWLKFLSSPARPAASPARITPGGPRPSVPSRLEGDAEEVGDTAAAEVGDVGWWVALASATPRRAAATVSRS